MEESKTVFFFEVPDKVWTKLYPKILKIYKKKIKEHFLQVGESYLKAHRPDNNEFYGFRASYQRLPLVIMDLLNECEIDKNDIDAKRGCISYVGDWKIVDITFSDVEWFMLRDLFKFMTFVDESHPTFHEFYDHAYAMTSGTIGTHILMTYSNLLIPTPCGNNESGARELERSLRAKFSKWKRQGFHCLFLILTYLNYKLHTFYCIDSQ